MKYSTADNYFELVNARRVAAMGHNALPYDNNGNALFAHVEAFARQAGFQFVALHATGDQPERLLIHCTRAQLETLEECAHLRMDGYPNEARSRVAKLQPKKKVQNAFEQLQAENCRQTIQRPFRVLEMA